MRKHKPVAFSVTLSVLNPLNQKAQSPYSDWLCPNTRKCTSGTCLAALEKTTSELQRVRKHVHHTPGAFFVSHQAPTCLPLQKAHRHHSGNMVQLPSLTQAPEAWLPFVCLTPECISWLHWECNIRRQLGSQGLDASSLKIDSLNPKAVWLHKCSPLKFIWSETHTQNQ